ncbi:transcriptional regulator, partial [Gardnerella vaginalis]
MDVRNKIKQIRLQSLLSQQDFAKQINVSFCTV